MEQIQPTDQERKDYALTLRNSVELGLGREDPLIKTSAMVFKKYPHHLVLIQAGGFLHAYGKSAYFLHKLKGYRLRVVGPEAAPSIRCGLPVSRHRRSLWHVFADYKVPYVVALGSRGNYQIHVSREETNSSLIDEIPDTIVEQLVAELSQTDRLRTARAAQILLRPEQSTFRLKQAVDQLYEETHKDLKRMPRDLRVFVGQDLADCLGRIIRLVYGFSSSDDRIDLLKRLSGDIDLYRYFLDHWRKVGKLNNDKFNLRAALIIEMGSLVGGLINKYRRSAPVR